MIDDRGCVLVSGANGTVGSTVVGHLRDLGIPLRAAGTRPDALRARWGDDEGVATVRLDLTEPAGFAAALDGCDRVFLMRPPHLARAADLAPFVDALRAAAPRLVVFLSLMGVERNPIPPHGRIERMIANAGLSWAHLRPGFFMQNLSGIHAEEIRTRDEVFVPAGRSRTSFVDADDIGRAAAVLLATPERFAGTAHTITGPEALTYTEVARILSQVLGRDIAYRSPSLLRYRREMIHRRGMDPGYATVTTLLYVMTRLGTASAVTDDYRRLTGVAPRTFEMFAREHTAQWRREPD